MWEVAAGSGQATAGLTRVFSRVVATDASPAQLEQMEVAAARTAACLAEAAPFRAGSVDVVAVAQALHWLDHARFFDEVRRVSKPGALLAAWSYRLPEIDDDLDPLLRRLARHDLRAFWPRERDHVESAYATIDVPFEEIPAPSFRIDAQLDVDAFLGYVRTWSAVARVRVARRGDPLAAFERAWRKRWEPVPLRRVSWPVTLRIFRVRD